MAVFTPWAMFTMGSLFPRLTSAGMGNTIMRSLGYIGFLIVWLLAPAPMAVADTAIIQPDGTQSLSQPAPPEEDLLNLED